MANSGRNGRIAMHAAILAFIDDDVRLTPD
jgi:hypothetical protein